VGRNTRKDLKIAWQAFPPDAANRQSCEPGSGDLRTGNRRSALKLRKIEGEGWKTAIREQPNPEIKKRERSVRDMSLIEVGKEQEGRSD